MWIRPLPADRVFLSLQGLFALFTVTVFTVSQVYLVESAHLNPLQLVLVGTTLEASAFVLQIPTGVVADVYSRRLSIVCGLFTLSAGILLWGAFSGFATILLAQVINAAGYCFVSGALEAWIADEAGSARAGRLYVRGAQAGYLGALAGAFLSVPLASYSLRLPFFVGGGMLAMLAVALALVMPENGFTPALREGRGSWSQMAHTTRAGFGAARARPVLLTILAIAVIYGMASEGFDRLWTVHLLRSFILPPLGPFKPIAWFAVINAVALLLSLAAAEIAKRRVDTNSHVAVARALFLINGLLVASVVAFALAGSFVLALATYWAVTLLRRTSTPLQSAWVNQDLEAEVRATVHSMASQADALGQTALGPVLGVIANVASTRVAIVVAGFVLVPALALYARTTSTRMRRA